MSLAISRSISPRAMGLRRQTVEHVFGMLKAWAGSTPLLTRMLEKSELN